MCRKLNTILLLIVAGLFWGGCGPVPIHPRLDLLSISSRQTYRDWDWARVLGNYVSDGIVDYESLARKPEPLLRYYALISVTGPKLTPDQFTNSQQVVAYWINAYNALVLCAVLHKYPTSTMYDLSMPRLEYEYNFNVDGKTQTLADIESELLKLTNNDVRIFFATCKAALGAPPLHNQPLRANILDRQLNEITAKALDNPLILTVDHARQSILLWQLILRKQQIFVKYMRSRRRTRATFLYNALLELASPQKKAALQGAVGYDLKPMPFDRTLNRRPSPQRSAVP